MVTGVSPEKPNEALMVMIAGTNPQLTAERKSNKGRVNNQCGEGVQRLIARWLNHHMFSEREINKNSCLTGSCSIIICCLLCCAFPAVELTHVTVVRCSIFHS